MVVSKVDENRAPIPGSEIVFDCDTVLLSVGLIPENELTRSAKIEMDTRTNGAIVYENMETSIPGGLEEAAEIDGCSPFGVFFRIVLPLSSPIIAVMALFYGVGHWNSYFNEMIFLSDHAKYPLQVILRELIIITQISGGDGATISNTEAKTAAEMQQLAGVIKYSVMIVSTLPIIVVYPFLQRFFVKGVMIGSIKG